MADEDFSEPLNYRLYEPRHMAAVAGISFDVLRQWVRRGLVLEVAIEGAEEPRRRGGAGRPAREFHVWQVHQVAIMATLGGLGVDLNRASRWSKVVCRKYWEATAGQERPRLMAFPAKKENPQLDDLFVIPESDVEKFSAAIPSGMKEFGGACLIVDIDMIMRNTQAALRALNAEDDGQNTVSDDAMLGANNETDLPLAAKNTD